MSTKLRITDAKGNTRTVTVDGKGTVNVAPGDKVEVVSGKVSATSTSGGALVVKTASGEVITLKGFVAAMGSDAPPALVVPGQVSVMVENPDGSVRVKVLSPGQALDASPSAKLTVLGAGAGVSVTRQNGALAMSDASGASFDLGSAGQMTPAPSPIVSTPSPLSPSTSTPSSLTSTAGSLTGVTAPSGGGADAPTSVFVPVAPPPPSNVGPAVALNAVPLVVPTHQQSTSGSGAAVVPSTPAPSTTGSSGSTGTAPTPTAPPPSTTTTTPTTTPTTRSGGSSTTVALAVKGFSVDGAVSALSTSATGTLVGTGTPGGAIELYVGATKVGATTADASGNWSFTPSAAWPAGIHALTAKSIVGGKVAATSAALQVTLDVAVGMPVVDGVAHTGLVSPISHVARPTLTGSGVPGGKIEVALDGVAVGTATIGLDGRWSLPLGTALASGDHFVTAVAVGPGASGHVSQTSVPAVVKVDLSPGAGAVTTVTGLTSQTDTGVSATDGLTALAMPTVKGTGAPNATMRVMVGGQVYGETTVGADGQWTYTFEKALAAGSNNVTAIAVSPTGVVAAAASAPFVVKLAPALADPDTGFQTLVSYPTASATKVTTSGVLKNASAVSVLMDGKPVPVTYETKTVVTQTIGGAVTTTEKTWKAEVTSNLHSGAHKQLVTYTDDAGAVAQKVATVNTSQTVIRPTITGLTKASDTGVSNTDGVTDAAPVVTGYGQPGDTISVLVNGQRAGDAVVGANGVWTLGVSKLNFPTNNVAAQVQVVSTHGDPADKSAPVMVRIGTYIDGYNTPGRITHIGRFDEMAAQNYSPPDAKPDEHGNTPDTYALPVAPRPTLRGTGVPNSIVRIFVQDERSNETLYVDGEVAVDATGHWAYNLQRELPVGQSVEVTARYFNPLLHGATGYDPSGYFGAFLVEATRTGLTQPDINTYTGNDPAVVATNMFDPTRTARGQGAWQSQAESYPEAVFVFSKQADSEKFYQTGKNTITLTFGIPGVRTVDGGTFKDDHLPPRGTVDVKADGSWTYDNEAYSTGIYTFLFVSAPEQSVRDKLAAIFTSKGIENFNQKFWGNFFSEKPAVKIYDDLGNYVKGTQQSCDGVKGTDPFNPQANFDAISACTEALKGGYTKIKDLGSFANKATTATKIAGGAQTLATIWIQNTFDLTMSELDQDFRRANPTGLATRGLIIEHKDFTGSRAYFEVAADGKSLIADIKAVHPAEIYGDALNMKAQAEVYMDGKLIATRDAGSNTLTNALSTHGIDVVPGSIHTFQVALTDLAGNRHWLPAERLITGGNSSQPLSSFTGNIAAATPIVAPFIAGLADADVAASAVANATTNPRPTIRGVGVPGASIQIKIDGMLPQGPLADARFDYPDPTYGGAKAATMYPMVTVGADGTWSYTVPTALSSGEHRVEAIAFIAHRADLGIFRVSPASTSTILVDGGGYAHPTIASLVGPDTVMGQSATARPTVQGAAPAGIVRVDLYVDGVLDSSVHGVTNGTWAAQLAKPLTDGAHQITAIGYAGSGKATAPSPALPIVIAAQALEAPVIAPMATNAPAPVLHGTAAAWATVTIYVDGVEMGKAKGGNWQFALPRPLADGHHVVTAVATDAFGKQSPMAAGVALTIDTALTGPTGFALLPAHDTSLAHTGWLTKLDRPVLTGAAKPDSLVTITIDGQIAGQATVNGHGTWSFTAPRLGDGAHDVSVVAVDRAGNVSAPSAVKTLTVDTATPMAPTFLGVVKLALGEGWALQGTAAPGSRVSVKLGAAESFDVTANAAGRWSATFEAKPEGGLNIQLTPTSASGVRGAATTVTTPTTSDAVTIALSGEALASPGIADGFTRVGRPTLTGTAAPGGAVDIYVDGAKAGSVATGHTGVYSFTLPTALVDGIHAVRAVSKGASSPAIVLTIDTGAPAVTVTGLAAGTDTGASAADGITSATSPTIRGTSEPGSTVTLLVDGVAHGTVVAGFDGAWAVPISAELAAGTHSFTAAAVDRAGNTATSNAGVSVVDGVVPNPPVVTGLSAATDSGYNQADGLTHHRRPTVVGTAAPGAIVTVYVDGATAGHTQADHTGEWALPLTTPLPANGTVQVTARAADFAGNLGQASAAKGVTVLTGTPGPMTIEAVATHATTLESVVGGRAPSGALVKVLIDGTAWQTVTATLDGAWTVTLPATIQPKDHRISAMVTDAAGNVGPAVGWGFNPPVVTGVSADTDTSTAGDGGATSHATPTLTGTGPASSLLEISVDNVVRGTVTSDAGGTWTLPITEALTPGLHTVTASLLDAQGHVVSSSAASSVLIETGTVKPRFTAGFGYFEFGEFVPRPFIGTSAPNAAIVIKIDGVIVAQGVADADGRFNLPSPTFKGTDGAHIVEIESTSPGGLKAVSDHSTAGNRGFGTSVTGVVDGALSNLLLTGDRPQFRGGASAFGAVTVYVDGAVYGTASHRNGMWVMDAPGAALAPGAHTVRVEIRASVGQPTLLASTTASFTVDAVAPAAPSLDWPFVGPAVSASPNGTPTITGKAVPGAFVTVYVDGQAIGHATADAAGGFSLTPAAPIAAGLHQITTRAVAPTGGMSDWSAPVPLVVSTSLVSPTITGTDPQPLVGPGDGSLLVPTDSPVLLGTAAPGATVRVFVDGRSLGLAIAEADGTWRFSMPVKLQEGHHRVSVTAYDEAGHESVAVTKAMVVDVDAQAADVSGVHAGVGGAQWALVGTAEANAKVLVTVDGVAVGYARAGANGAWAYDVSDYVGDTPHAIVATVVNASGASNPVGSARTVAVSHQVSVSGLSAATDLGAFATDDLTSVTRPVLEGAALPGSVVQVVIDGVTVGTTTANSAGAWAYAVVAPLSEGPHAIKAIATDAAGNVAITPAAATITVDVTGPAAPTVTSLAVVNGIQEIRGTTEPGATVEVFVAGVSVGTATADVVGAWSRPLATPIAGTPTDVTARSTDVVGNLGVQSAPVALSTRPTALGVHPDSDTGVHPYADKLTLANASDHLTNLARPTLRGTGVAGASVQVFIDGQSQGTAPVDATGQWRFTPTAPLGHAAHTVAAAPIDGGVVGTPTAAAPFVVDLVGPAITQTLAARLDPASTATHLITDHPIVTLTGTTEPGALVQLFGADGSFIQGNPHVAGADGKWTTEVTNLNPMGNQVMALVMKSTDAAGNVTESPFTVDFRLSVTAPTFQGTAPRSYDPATLIQGKASAHDTVRVTIDGGAPVVVETDADGTWRFAPATPIGAGAHVVTAQAVDSFGKTSPVSTLHLHVDTSPTPIVPVGALTDGVSIDADFGIKLSGLIPNGRARVVVTRPDGTTADAWDTVVGANGEVTFTTPLSGGNGIYTFTATAYDTHGYARPAGTFSVNGQNVFHTNTTIVVDEGLQRDQFHPVTADSTPIVRGQASASAAGATVRVAVGGGATYSGVVAADGSWAVPVTETLADRHHSVNVSFVSPYGKIDSLGGASGFHHGFEVATSYKGAAPDLFVESYAPLPATGGVRVPAGSGTVVEWGGQPNVQGAYIGGGLQGIGSDSSDVIQFQVDGQDVGAPISASGFSFRPWPEMADGRHVVTVVAIDKAGNRSAPSAGVIVNKDSVAPVTTVDGLSGPFDSGTSPADKLTNLRDVTITGKTKPHAIVTIVTERGNEGTVTADDLGDWRFTATNLGHGAHTVRATATSPGRLVGAPSDVYTYTVDLQLPEATVFTDPTPSSHGLAGSATPTLHGTAELGSVVTLKFGDTVLATLPVDAGGNWSYTIATPLAEGAHTFTATVMDAAGNVNATPASTTVVVDLSAPAAALAVGLGVGSDTGLDQNDHRTNMSAVTISGSAEAWASIEVFVDGQSVGTATTTDHPLWSLPNVPLVGQGAHQITTVVTDRFGRVGGTTAASPLVVTLDSEAPTTPVAPVLAAGSDSGDPTDGLTNVDRPTLIGTVEAHARVTVLVDGVARGAVQTDATGAWSHLLAEALTPGAHTITTTTTDAAGNVSAASPALSLTVDTAGPAPVIAGLTDPTGASATNALTGTAKTGSTITVSVAGQTLPGVTADASGAWSVPFGPLPVGTHSFEVVATDPAGTTRTAATTLTFSAPAPAVITAGGNTAGTTDTDAELSGTAPVGTEVRVYDGNTLLATVPTVNGAWSYTATNLAHGTHGFKAVAVDAAGHASADSAVVTYSVDTQAPDAPVVIGLEDPTASLSFNYTNQILGTAEAGSTVVVTLDDRAPVTVTANEQGQWAVPVASSSLEVGSHTVKAQAIDAAGNVGPLTVDTSIVIAPVTPPTIALAGTLTPVSNADAVTLTGTAPTFAAGGVTTIHVYDGATLVGTTTTHQGLNGAWQLTAPLSHGSHSFTATATDDAGHLSAASAERAITVDREAPAAPTLTGFADPLAYDTANVLSGTAEKGSTLLINYGNAQFTATADATTGVWSVAVPGSANYYGGHAVSITATDSFGNASAPYAYAPIVVPLPPGGTFDGPATYAPSTQTLPTFTGKAPKGALVFLVVDGTATDYGHANADANGDWRITADRPLPHGATTFGLRITIPGSPEVLGAQSAIVYHVDIQGPGASTPVLADPTAFGIVANALTGTAEVGSTVTVRLDDGAPQTFVIDGTGTWSLPVASSSLAAGTHTVTTTITDALGNVGTPGSLVFTIENPASPLITGAHTSTLSNVKTATISGTAAAGTTVQVYDNHDVATAKSVLVDAGGAWTVTFTGLAEDLHTFTATATDPAQRTSGASQPIHVTVDSLAPAEPTIDALPTTPTIATRPTLTGQAEQGSTVLIFDNGGTEAVATAIADAATGHWTVTLPTALGHGTHAFTAKARDAAGNTSVASSGIGYVVDLVAPTQPTLTTVSGSHALHPVISGTFEAESDLLIMVNGAVVETLTGLAGTTFSYDFPDGIGQGARTITVQARDAALNLSPVSAPLTFDVDTVNPVEPRFTLLVNPGQAPGLAHASLINTGSPTFHAIAEAGSTITLFDQNGQPLTVIDEHGVERTSLLAGSESVTGSVVFSPKVPYGPGEHTIAITSTDAHGNASSGSLTFTVRLPDTAPTIGYLVQDPYTIGDSHTTSGTQPTFQGTAAQRAVVAIAIDGVPVAQVTADDEGRWTYQSATALLDGSHSVTADVLIAGVSTGAPATTPFAVNSQVPPAISDVVLTSAGSYQEGGGLQHVNGKPTLTGKSSPGALIRIWGSFGAVGPVNFDYTDSVVTLADGTWRYTFTEPLAAGFNAVFVEASNSHGTSWTEYIPFLVDPVVGVTPDAPTLDPLSAHAENGLVIDGSVTGASAITLSGTAKPGATVLIYQMYSAPEDALLATAVAGLDGAWKVTNVALPAGSGNQFVAVATKDGQTGTASAPITFELDQTAPEPQFQDFTITQTGAVALGAATVQAYEPGNRSRVHTVQAGTTAQNGTYFLDRNHDDVVDAGEALVAGAVFTSAEAADLKYFANNLTGDSLVLTVADAFGNTAPGTHAVRVDNVAPTVTAAPFTVNPGGIQTLTFSYTDVGDASRVKVQVLNVGHTNGIFYIEKNGAAGYQGGDDTYIYDNWTFITLDDLTSGRVKYAANDGNGTGDTLSLRVTDGAGHTVDVTVAPTAPTPYRVAGEPADTLSTSAWWEQPGIDLAHLTGTPATPQAPVADSMANSTVVPPHALEQALLSRVLGTGTTHESSVWDHAPAPGPALAGVDFGSVVDQAHPNAYLELLHLAQVGQG